MHTITCLVYVKFKNLTKPPFKCHIHAYKNGTNKEGSIYTDFIMVDVWVEAKENQISRGNFSRTDNISFFHYEQ